MTQRKTLIVVAMLTAMLGACKTPQPQPAATASVSALCLIDRPLPVEVAPTDDPDFVDEGNRFDTEATRVRVETHNARYRAACPD